MKRIAFIIAPLALVALAFATRTHADNPNVLEGKLVGSVANVTIRGIDAGFAPWMVKSSKVQLSSTGRLHIRCKGLLISPGVLANGSPVPPSLIGTVGPVQMVSAGLTLGGPGNGTPVTILNSDPVPLSATGDFEINTMVSIPPNTAQPILVIRIANGGTPGPWIAVADTDDDEND